MNIPRRFRVLALILTLSLGITSFAYAEGAIDKALRLFQEEWTRVEQKRHKPDHRMMIPSQIITVSFTYYQIDVPTLGLKSVEFYDGKLFITYINGTGLILSIERKYTFPPDVWGLKLDTIIACLMNQKDMLPPEYGKTSARFKQIREIFWRGVAWTKNRTRGPFHIYQMYRDYAFLEPNTAYMIRSGGNIEAVLLHGTIDTEVFTKIVDSIRYRPGAF